MGIEANLAGIGGRGAEYTLHDGEGRGATRSHEPNVKKMRLRRQWILLLLHYNCSRRGGKKIDRQAGELIGRPLEHSVSVVVHAFAVFIIV